MFQDAVAYNVRSKGQMSVDLLIAVSVLVFAITMASYYIITSFTPYVGRDIDLQASAYRVAMILSEDGGLWVAGKNLLESDWEKYVNLTSPNVQEIRQSLKRIGLANSSSKYIISLSYEVCIPCYLNETKVLLFFNRSLWEKIWPERKGYPYDYTLDELATLIGLNSSIRHYYYNISILYMNGSVVVLKGERLTIGYRLYSGGRFIPRRFGKFERIVVIDGQYDPRDPVKSFRRLVVYVW